MLLNERTSLESFIIKPPAHSMPSDVALIQIFIENISRYVTDRFT